MTEEKKEKPDWLSDFQNNQATNGKQTYSEGENNGVTLDINGPVITYVSPRYGRRSITGVKSVENSPKKGSSVESKPIPARSNSARPALLNINTSGFREDKTTRDFIPLQISEKDLGTISVQELSETLENVIYPGSGNLLHSKINWNLEDSWNSLSVFNIKQKGRLCSNGNIYVKQHEEDKYKKDSNERFKIFETNILTGDNTSNKSFKDEKGIHKSENWREARKICENEITNKANTSRTDIKDFIIPELPQGKYLVFNVRTTWGDRHYLGLNGIEIFNSKGKKVQVKSISADPPNINILPEYSRDPRVVENLIDGIYLTQDDMHMWLAPFTPNSSHLIFIEFYEIEELAMLRIWNYNKSRIHCFRGAKDMEIKLDNEFIFIGEIARASGEILNTLNCLGDTILFTTDDNILEMVAENDEYFNYSTLSHLEDHQTTQEEFRPLTGGNNEKQSRPFTCPKKNSGVVSKVHSYPAHYEEKQKNISEKFFGEEESLIPLLGNELEKEFDFNVGERSCVGSVENFSSGVMKTENSVKGISSETKSILTMGLVEEDSGEQAQSVLDPIKLNTHELKSHSPDEKSEFIDKNYTMYIPSVSFLPSDSLYETLSMPTGYNFTIQIHSTWGDLYYVGLNGLQIFDENNAEIKIGPDNITADPESVNVLDEINNDARTPDKLIDGVNDSTDGYHMWLAPVLPLTINRIDLKFQNPVTLSSLKLWNYAKTPSRGVREFGILVDGLLIYNGELDQAVNSPGRGLPRVPCKTVNFSDSNRVQTNKSTTKRKEETFYSADQSQRPLTTMTSHS